jgi:Ca2+/Na+ antiporter
MLPTINGAILLAYAISGLFFLKYWQRTKDRLFLMFAGAFWLLALQRFLFALLDEHNENSYLVYLIRLLAFIVIIVAIIDKNRSDKKSGSQ